MFDGWKGLLCPRCSTRAAAWRKYNARQAALRRDEATLGSQTAAGLVAAFERRADDNEQICQWFALCTNVATTVQDHPTLGAIPVCCACKELIRRLGA